MDEAEKSLDILARKMTPILNPGEFVFCTVPDPHEAGIARGESVCEFREAEGVTVVIDRSRADSLKLDYDFVAAWITLQGFFFGNQVNRVKIEFSAHLTLNTEQKVVIGPEIFLECFALLVKTRNYLFIEPTEIFLVKLHSGIWIRW